MVAGLDLELSRKTLQFTRELCNGGGFSSKMVRKDKVMSIITSNNCDPVFCPFCVDNICTFECASISFKNEILSDVLLDEKELNNIDSSKMEQKGEYYE